MLTIKSGNGDAQPFAAVIVAGDFKHMGSIDGLIGNSFLRGRKILIDFKNSKVFISDARQKDKNSVFWVEALQHKREGWSGPSRLHIPSSLTVGLFAFALLVWLIGQR